MPVLTAPLQHEGPMVDVALGWSDARARQLRLALRPVPQPVTTRALIDTGAEMTCVDTGLVRALGLPAGMTVPVTLPAHGGWMLSSVYPASLTVVHPSGNTRDNLLLRDLSVLDAPLAALGYQALIGRDVLARCRFLYNGRDDRFRLSY